MSNIDLLKTYILQKLVLKMVNVVPKGLPWHQMTDSTPRRVYNLL